MNAPVLVGAIEVVLVADRFDEFVDFFTGHCGCLGAFAVVVDQAFVAVDVVGVAAGLGQPCLGGWGHFSDPVGWRCLG